MDMGAFVQIERLEKMMKNNKIEVPRLRGLRLMSEQKPIEDIETVAQENMKAIFDLCEDEAEAEHTYRQSKTQMNIYNSYCGRKGVLMIHARCGGDYDALDTIQNEPWFLNMARDGFDGTYIDIYAKVKE